MMIVTNLAQILKEKNMTMYQLNKLTGIRPNTLSQWYHNKDVKAFNAETLSLVCEALKCDVGDILKYKPDRRLK